MKIQLPIDKNIHIYHFTKSETALIKIYTSLLMLQLKGLHTKGTFVFC